MLVSITRLRIKSPIFLPVFFWNVYHAVRQAKGAGGYRGGCLLVDANRAYWTMTVWDDVETMRSYMTADPHRGMMPKLMRWCDEASTVHWDIPTTEKPTWSEAYEKMRRGGRVVNVHEPSRHHADLSFAAPRATRGLDLPPRRTGKPT